jgi:hypothetical protein
VANQLNMIFKKKHFESRIKSISNNKKFDFYNIIPKISTIKPLTSLPKIKSRKIKKAIRITKKKILKTFTNLKKHFQKLTPNQKKILYISSALLTVATLSLTWYLTHRPSYNPYFKATPKDSNYIYQNTNKDFKVYLGSKDNPNTPTAKFEISENKYVQIEAQNLDGEKIDRQKFNQSILYKNANKSYDINYKIIPTGLKEDIIFNKAPANDSSNPLEFSFIISYPQELEIKERYPNELTFYEKNGSYAFHFVKPFMIDKKDQKSEDIKIKVNRIIPKEEEVGNQIIKYLITFTPNIDWLTASDRKYPIILDPTIVHDTSSEFGEGDFNRSTDSGSGNSPALETNFQELSADENTKGLWHLNETSGTSVADSSGNGNTGTATGTTIVDGKLNNARNFNGTSDLVSLGNPSSLQITGNQTIEMWLYPTDMTVRRNPYAKAYGGEGTITQEINGTLTYFYGTAGANTTPYQGFSTGVSISTNQWSHVAIVRDLSNMQLYWYINGELVNQTVASYSYATVSSLTAYIGEGYTNNYAGIIDEFRISNKARTSEEIKASASRRPYSVYTSKVIDFGQTPISINSLYWSDNMITETPSGTIEFQTRTSADGSTWESWKPTTGETAILSMDSDASSWSWSNISSYSDETSIKMEGSGSLRQNIGKLSADANTVGLWHLDEDDTPSIYLNNSYPSFSGWSSTSTSTCGTYQMMGGYNIFGNGASTQKTITNLPTGTYDTTFNYYHIDSWDSEQNEYGYLSWNGGQIWNRYYGWSNYSQSNVCGNSSWGESVGLGFPTQSVTINHTAGNATLFFGSNLTSAPNDESWGVNNITVTRKTDIIDSSSNGNNGTTTGTASYSDSFSSIFNLKPKYIKGRSFDGDNDYINFGVMDALNGPAELTIELWFKRNSDVNSATNHGVENILIANSSSSANDNLEIGTDGTNIDLYLDTNGTDINTSFNAGISDNVWYHLAFTYNNGDVIIYLNGTSVYTNTSGTTMKLASVTPLTLGVARPDGDLWGDFNGMMDEVRISNTPRSPEEIRAGYYAGVNNHESYLSKTLSSPTDLSSANKLSFYIASDRPGTFLQSSISESAFAAGKNDGYTEAVWHFDDENVGLISDASTYYDYDTFELYQPGGNDDWSLRNTNDPYIVSTTSYTGDYSLYMDSDGGWGSNFEGSTGLETGQTSTGYDTNTYPYMCMAYKIPSTTANNMLINVNGSWRSITMTAGEIPTTYPRVASWNPLNADNQWHYKCIDLDAQLDGSLGTSTHTITAVIWHSSSGITSIAGEFWIDDFIISKNEVYIPYANTEDVSGNLIDGTITGANPSEGKIGKGKTFDGVDDFISFPDDSSIDFNYNQNFTVSFWVKAPSTQTTTTTTTNAIIEKWTSSSGYPYVFRILNQNYIGSRISGEIQFARYDGTNSPIAWSNAALNDNQWHHIAGVKNGSSLQMYVDGVLTDTTTDTTTTTTTNTSPLFIGNRNGNYNFQGSVDELRIDSYARSADEIAQAYNYDSRTHPITIDFVTSPQSTYTSGTSIAIKNSSGTTNLTDTLSIGETIILKQEENGTEYLSQAEVKNITNTSSTYGTVTLASALSSIPPSGFTSSATVFKWQKEYWDISNIPSTHKNAITKFDIRVSDRSQEANFFLDDIRYNTNYLNQSWGNTITSTPNRYLQYKAILTGTDLSTTASTPQVSRVNVNYTLTEEENLNNPIAYWKFDEGYGTTAYDETLENNDATLNNMESTDWVNGHQGSALDLGGTDEYLSTTASYVNFSTTPMALTAFVNTPEYITLGTGFFILDKFSSNKGYRLYINSSGYPTFVVGDGTNVSTVTGNKKVNDEIWHSIVASRSGSGVLNIYVDGISAGSAEDNTGNIASIVDITIGRDSAGSNYFKGKLDELSIYEYALSAPQAKVINNRNSTAMLGLPKDDSPQPIGYWTFDEATGTIASDQSANENDGTLKNMTDADHVVGKIGKALDFDGTDDYVNMGNNNRYDFTSEDFSVSFYAKAAVSQGSNKRIIARGNYQQDGWEIFNSDGGVSLRTYQSGTHQTTSALYTDDGNWHHIEVVRNGSSVSIYIDGIYSNSSSATHSNPTSSADNLEIGYNTDQPGYKYTGLIDEIKIYNYARTADQILTEYKSGGPIAHYKFDEGYGTTAYDETDNSYDGTLTSPVWTSTSKEGKALGFDGTTSNMALSSALGTNTAFGGLEGTSTVSFWMYPETDNTNVGIFKRIGGWYYFGMNANSILQGMVLNCITSANYWPTSNTSIPLDTWTHIVVELSGQGYKIYINGNLDKTISEPDLCIYYVGTPSFGQDIVSWADFKGKIDSLKIYNYALTPEEVKIDYNQSSVVVLSNPKDINGGADPIGFWKLDENTGTTANDSSGNGNTGTLTNGPVWESNGKIGSAVTFDGSNDYINANIGSYFGSNNPLTVEAWVKVSATTNGPIFGVTSSPPGAGWNMPFLSINGNTVYGWIYNLTQISTTVSDGWHHLSLTYNPTAPGTTIFYVDGVEVGSTTGYYSGSGTTDYWTTYVSGVKPSGVNSYLNGTIDQVKIYNYARTQRQIMFDYNNGGPIAHWKMDETSGGTAHDETGNHNGIINNTDADTLTAPGKVNNGFDFDGANDSITAGTGADYFPLYTLSSCAWIKTAGLGAGMSKAGILSITYGWFMELSASGYFQTYFHNGTSGTYQTISQNLFDNQWHHLCVTYDGIDRHMYVDGIKRLSAATSWTGSTIWPTNIIRIGTQANNPTIYMFDGLIDDVKLYNYCRTDEEIKQDYNQGTVRFQ